MTLEKLQIRKKELEDNLQQVVANYNMCSGHLAEVDFQINQIKNAPALDNVELIAVE